MVHNTPVKSRKRYATALRDAHAEATRTRILEALVSTMANGVAGLSIAAVAREAGVSTLTIYRHFGSKQGLLEALSPYVIAKSGLMPDEPPPATFAELERLVRRLFRSLAGMDQTLRAAMASELGQHVRSTTMARRRAIVRETVVRLAPDLPATQVDRLAAVFLILMATPNFQALKDYLELGPDASAELVSWAMGALLQGARIQSNEHEEA